MYVLCLLNECTGVQLSNEFTNKCYNVVDALSQLSNNMALSVDILINARIVSNLFNDEIVYMLTFIIPNRITLRNIANLMDWYWFSSSIYLPCILLSLY